MIEDKEDGIKVAESKEEALVSETIQRVEKGIAAQKLQLELDQVVLKHLQSKAKV